MTKRIASNLESINLRTGIDLKQFFGKISGRLILLGNK